jgi:DNA polymerase/3'-5' exonuclease PolX
MHMYLPGQIQWAIQEAQGLRGTNFLLGNGNYFTVGDDWYARRFNLPKLARVTRQGVYWDNGMPYPVALAVAEELVASMRPHCDRIQIAGSIRREKKVGIKDIEIVCRPTWQSIIGQATPTNLLYQWANSDLALADTPISQWIKPNTDEIIPWEVKPEGRYWRAILTIGAKLDIFIPRRDGWAAQLLIRTGSAAFSEAVMTYAHRVNHLFADGVLYGPDGNIVCGGPEDGEEAVFEALGLRYVPPQKRGEDAAKAILEIRR